MQTFFWLIMQSSLSVGKERMTKPQECLHWSWGYKSCRIANFYQLSRDLMPNNWEKVKHQTNAVLFYLQLPVRNAATVSESPRMKTFSVYRWVSGLFQIFLLYQYYSKTSIKWLPIVVWARPGIEPGRMCKALRKRGVFAVSSLDLSSLCLCS